MTDPGYQRANNAGRHTAKLLIVDDDPTDVLPLREMLGQAGYRIIQSTSDPLETLRLAGTFYPDLILLDLVMPRMDGTAVMEQLKMEQLKQEFPGKDAAPILVLTADSSLHSKRQALAGGAKDILTKPFDAVELLLRIDNLLETRFLHLDLQRQNHSLEERVQARTSELESARQSITDYARLVEASQTETLGYLARASEFHDDATGQHTLRVGETTTRLAARLGFPPARLPWLQQAARLHDIGKIGISDQILLKPGKLTESEFEVMKTHTTIGAEMLRGGQTELFQMAQQIAASHHERWDGRGYPQGLAKEEIPLAARIVAVADVFDALTHDRPYKSAWTAVDARTEIRRQSGLQFDPQVVHEFLHLPIVEGLL